MKRIGIIDIGSNSVRLVLFRIYANGSFKIIDELKESIRLAEGMDENNIILEEKINSAIDTIKTFKLLCNAMEVDEITAVATEAVRKAKNQQEFINKIYSKTNIMIKVLSGYDEAYYDYLGVINSMDIKDALIMDIGGSSTELIWVEDKKTKESISLPIGAINLTQKFITSDNITCDIEKNLSDYIMKYFSSVPWLGKIKNVPLIGVGGTIRNLSKIHRKKIKYPLEITHNYTFTNKDINEIYEIIKSKPLSQRKKIPGISKDRADILPGASLAIISIIKLCSINTITISGNGLREGLVYDNIINNFGVIDDVLNFSIKNIITDYHLSSKHSDNVYKITRKLFYNIVENIDCDYDIDKIIKTSAMLHDCGYTVSYYNHHKHSFYVIINSRINGLSHKELIMSAFIASCHRKDNLKINISQYSSVLDKQDVEVIKKIGVILKLAESLDRSRAGLITDIKPIVKNNKVTLELTSTNNVDVEINDAQKSCANFKKVFNKKLILTNNKI